MKKYIKLLSPFFFVVASITILCIGSYATGEVTGVPVISVNGNVGEPITTALTLEEGDVATIISSGISTGITIPDGATVTLNPSVNWVVTSSIVVYGQFNIFGNITRSNNPGTGGASNIPENAVILVPSDTNAVINQNFGSIVRDGGRRTIDMSSGTYNLYSGSIVNNNASTSSYTVTTTEDAQFNFYSGSISGNYVFTDPTSVNFNGNTPVITEEPRTYTVTPATIGSVTNIVTESVSWLGAFADAIVSNSILLLFVLLGMVGLGVGLIRRIKE